ncbi:MAG: ubiquinone/menaquinone biosynthesis methyltransferase [Dehalococcoidales bacterium]|jgi:demethylmenaquinone methyltransferase/2-methoxy-6-polyprenyl-1,4-benzoquinol methylase
MENQNAPEAPRPLHGMFTAVPPRYDLINSIITLGMDKRWRRKAALACLEDGPKRILDIGCGTGDLSINIARLAGKDTEVTGLDYSPPMLAKARQKAEQAGVKVSFIEGDATHLPFPDAFFDRVGISFAFRNLTYKNPLGPPHLAEVLRVLKPGGRYIAVESSQPENAFIRACFHLYLRAYVGPAGQLLSGNKGAYHYLAESARHYHSPTEVREMLLGEGFREVRYQPLFFGAAGLHTAFK